MDLVDARCALTWAYGVPDDINDDAGDADVGYPLRSFLRMVQQIISGGANLSHSRPFPSQTLPRKLASAA